MRVKALQDGYYGLKRHRTGDIFVMHEDDYERKDESGKPMKFKEGHPRAGQVIRCKWVQPLESKTKADSPPPAGKGKGKGKAKAEPEPTPNSPEEQGTQDEVL